MLDHALYYASIGWYVLPVHSIKDGICTCRHGKECSQPGKHPACQHGLSEATKDQAKIKRWFQNNNRNIGINMGMSGLYAVDVDKGGEEHWRELQIQNGEVETLTQTTGSGNKHYIFEGIGGSGVNKLAPKIDVRSDGGYIVAEPSIHVSGGLYSWDYDLETIKDEISPLPEWLNIKKEYQQNNTPAQFGDDTPYGLAALNDECNKMMNTKEGSRNHTLFQCSANMGELIASAQLSEMTARHKLTDAASFAGLKEREIKITINSGLKAGIKNPRVIEHTQVDLSAILSKFKKKETSFTLPDGPLKSFYDHIMATCIREQPALALGATLAMGATALGQKYEGSTLARTNMYICNIAPTGAGKDHPRQCIKKFFDMIDGKDFLAGEEVYSGQGVIAALAKHPIKIFMLDEFGLKMQSLKGGGASNCQNPMDMLMKIFSSAKNTYIGAEYADQKNRPRVDIDCPSLTVLATTTSETLYPALASAEVLSGFLPRILFIESKCRGERRRIIQKKEFDIDLLRWGRTAVQRNAMDAMSPKMVPKTKKADDLFWDFVGHCDKQRSVIWTRAEEIAQKIAIILACSENIIDPIITEKEAIWTLDLVKHQSEKLVRSIEDRISDSPYEKLKKEFLISIKESKFNGVKITDTNKKAPFSSVEPRLRKQILKDLEDGGLIYEARAKQDKAGRPSKIYVHFEYLMTN